MSLLLLSFIAGILTVLAPCAFMLLPVIIGGSVGNGGRYRPYIITISLSLSLFLFTVLLKATSLLINIDPVFLKYFSGITVIFLGLISLFPETWDNISAKFRLSSTSDGLLDKAKKKNGVLGAILTGAALGPVFSACSPTYVYILTTVLRQNLQDGLVNMLAYILGLSAIMLGVAVLGRKFIKSLKFAVNPQGIFKKTIAIIFILVGIAIITGIDKQLQSNFGSISPVSQFEEKLLQKTTQTPTNSSNGELFNVNPPTKAPELEGIAGWINSDGEKISNLKGKVVLIDFWTYSCVNCLRSSPYINTWYSTYKDQGFTVLGIHAPEFAFEKNKDNVEKSVRDTYKIQYPVGLDNDFKTWDAYHNQFWPAKYLIDKDGNIRYTHFGEGEYDKTEQAIRALLQENGQKLSDTMASDKVANTMVSTDKLTPETYLGWGRSDRQQNDSKVYNRPNSYTFGSDLKTNYWDLEGNWQIDNEQIISKDSKSKLRLHYSAREVYIVAGSPTTAKVGVTINQKAATTENKGLDVDSNSQLSIQEDRLYKVVKHDTLTDGYLELTVPEGTHLNVFTFG